MSNDDETIVDVDSPVVEPPVRITIGQDSIKLTLSFHHRQMLRFAAERNGRFLYTFGLVQLTHSTLTIDQRKEMARKSDDSIKEMEKIGLFNMTHIIGPSYAPETYEFALTDIGRNVIHQMGIVVKPQTLTVDMKTGKEVINNG